MYPCTYVSTFCFDEVWHCIILFSCFNILTHTAANGYVVTLKSVLQRKTNNTNNHWLPLEKTLLIKSVNLPMRRVASGRLNLLHCLQPLITERAVYFPNNDPISFNLLYNCTSQEYANTTIQAAIFTWMSF